MITLTYGVLYRDKERSYIINPIPNQHLRGPDALKYSTMVELFSHIEKLSLNDRVTVNVDSKTSYRDSQDFVNNAKRKKISLEKVIRGQEILFQKEEMSGN